jgi:hypothetical protein
MERTINTMMDIARRIEALAAEHDIADIFTFRRAGGGLNILITGCFLSDAEWLHRRAKDMAGECIRIFPERGESGLLLELMRA